MARILNIGIAAGIALAVGTFGPWENGPLGQAVDGPSVGTDGWIVLGAGVAAAFFAWRWRETGKRRLTDLLVLGGATLWAEISDYRQLAANRFWVPGWGLQLDLLASSALVLVAVVAAVYAGRAS